MRERINKNNLSNKGFTIIEAMIVVFIVSVIIVTFYSVFSLGTKHIIEAKNRLTAVALVNERMETIRNLDYASIGTKRLNPDGSYSYGIPAGDILEDEVIVKRATNFYVHTFVQYMDDSYDGTLGGSPGDAIPNDYKKVKIRVAWENDLETTKAVYLVSTFVPKGVEQNSGGGVLSINVIDNQGVGIPQAVVRIINSAQHVDVSTTTDDSGNITLVGAPNGTENYSIFVSKSNYFSVNTFASYPASNFDPVDKHASVVEGDLNMKSVRTDRLSRLTVNFKDPFENPIPSFPFTLAGGRQKGKTVIEPIEDVFYYKEDSDSDTDGTREFSNMSSGVYTITPLNEDGDYEFIQVDNNQLERNVIDLSAGSDLEVNAVLVSKDVNSVLVKVVAEEEGEAGDPIAGASVELRKDSSGYSATLTTDRYGYAFFPTELPELESGEYNLSVSADGYASGNSTIDVTKLVGEEVRLVAN